MIGIVDYGLGNVQAIGNIYKRLDIPYFLAHDAKVLTDATHVILPGVGAFDWAMARLNESGMRETLDRMILGEGRPVLGICVGMQMMAKRSDEGVAHGLGWFDAEVRLFDHAKFSSRTHLPHMGWNDVYSAQPGPQGGLMEGLEEARFYFLHSYYFAPSNGEDVLAWTPYGDRFASAVRRGQINGVQFHPEKSHQWGIRLLKNFACL